MTIRYIALALALLAAVSTTVAAQDDGCVPSGAALRAIVASAGGNTSAAMNPLYKAVAYPSVMEMPQILHSSDGLNLVLQVPGWTYADAIYEAIRKRDKLEDVPFISAFRVLVSPSTINSPDIIKVIVERDGKEIAPLASGLKPTPLSTRLGATVTLHAGAIAYPCSAFRPGASVTITAIPQSGSNIVATLSSKQLEAMSGMP